jgi:hypothetical protein
MPADHLLLSLISDRATQQKGWHRRGGSYDDSYVELIPDPTDATPKRLLTAIPSPYARIHLFDAAFHFVADRAKTNLDHSGTSVFHRAVSDCLDVLELLYSWSSHSQALKLITWSPLRALPGLKQSAIEGQRLLANVLALFLNEDGQTAHFDEQQMFYLLLLENHVIAASSPLTLFIAAPEAAEITLKSNLINPETGQIYFSVIRPLHVRKPDFQQYIHWLFFNRKILRKYCRHMYEYLKQSLALLESANRELASVINAFETTGMARLDNQPDPLLDSESDPVTVLGAQLYERSRGRKRDELKRSPMVIKSRRLPAGAQDPPLVLEELRNSFGNPDGKTTVGDVSNIPLAKRVLPDSGVTYPYLVLEDFIEDRIIRLPFRMNSGQFECPRYRDFTPEDDWSFLLPLKTAFFDYFDPADVSNMSRLVRSGGKGDEDSVTFELDIPVIGGRKVTFRKTFNLSKQMPNHGNVVRARMSCAIYPSLVVTNHEEFNERYWVMLVDDEREPASRSLECFDLQFYRLDGQQIMQRVSDDTSADQYFKKTKRSDKEDQSGSCYFELNSKQSKGAYFDYAVVEAFHSDANRVARGVIVPKWTRKSLGTRGASVAIDFGTTNTHVAWSFSDGNPDPKVLSVGQDDLQLAILSAPVKNAPSESARFNFFPSELAGFEIRLQHEFLPAIIGGTSPFKFPLRTATSEQMSLQPDSYHLLRNVNISFIRGIVPHRKDEVISTELKWSLEVTKNVMKRVDTYIRELLLLVRTKMILNDVDPRQVRIVWFKPLSFDGFTRTFFEGEWEESVKEIFQTSTLKKRLLCLTESEAPYYYHEQAAAIATSKPVLCIDIGGGSTDIVVFEQKAKTVGKMVPTIGTSISFAGNALWGDGYNRVHSEQSGLVRKYKGQVEESLRQIQDETLRRNMQDVYKELQTAQNGSEEYVNFFFSIDKEIEFTKRLMLDGWVKCLVLIHYSAIMFHCAQLMRARGMEAPQYICLSGRGAQSIKILDSSEDKKEVTALTHAIFEAVFGTALHPRITLRMAEKFKEATCNGGVLKGPDDSDEPTPVVLVGDGSVAIEEAQQMSYAQIGSDGKTLDAVIANVGKFADTLLQLNSSLNFRKRFGIDVDFGVVEAALKGNVREHIGLGLQRHNYTERPNERINETLFFYPLIQNLFELGKNVAGTQSS